MAGNGGKGENEGGPGVFDGDGQGAGARAKGCTMIVKSRRMEDGVDPDSLAGPGDVMTPHGEMDFPVRRTHPVAHCRRGPDTKLT